MSATDTTLTQRMARFVVGLTHDTLPAHAHSKLRTCVVNGLGMALGSLRQPEWPHAVAAVMAMDGERPDGATLLGDGRRSTVAGATVANSVLFYGGGGQCDTLGTVHMGLSVIPLTLAMAECGHPVDRVLPAMLAGYEVAGLLDQAYGRHSAALGFRATPLYGTLGIAAAAGRMLGLDEAQMASALGIAASSTGGLLQPFEDGSSEARHQPGAAIRNGLAAAQLARAGVKGAHRALEGRAGLVRAVTRGDCDVEALASRLGVEWSIDRVQFKPFPICAFNQTPVLGAIALREAGVDLADVERIEVRMNSFETRYAGMDSKGPFATQTSRTMSIPFCIAMTLVDDAPYGLKALNVPDIAHLGPTIAKIDLVTDDTVDNLSAVIALTMKNGERVVRDQRMSFQDYTFSFDAIDQLVRRVGRDAGVPDAAYDRVVAFANGLPASPFGPIFEAFALAVEAGPAR